MDANALHGRKRLAQGAKAKAGRRPPVRVRAPSINRPQLAIALAASIAVAAANAAGVFVQIQNAWVRPADSDPTAAPLYLDLTSNTPLTLIGARSEAARTAVLMTTDPGDRSTARPVTSFDIVSGTRLRFAPRGSYVELRGITEPIRVGDSVPFTLEFVAPDGKPVRASGEALVRDALSAPGRDSGAPDTPAPPK